MHHRAGADLADLAGDGPAGAPLRPPGSPPTPRRRTSVAAALAACAPGTTAVLLAPAPPDGEVDPWETTALAHGLPLVRGSDLVVSAGRLLVRTTSGRSPVGVVLRALADDELDPVVSSAPGAVHGCAGLLTAVRAGGVVLAPALGAGLADDEAVRRRTPDLVRWALGEEPLLGEAAHPEGPPLVRLVTISDGVDVDVVPGLDVPASGGPVRPGGPRAAGPTGIPAPPPGDGDEPVAQVARLWRGGGHRSLLPPAPPTTARGRGPTGPALPGPVPHRSAQPDPDPPPRATTGPARPHALDLRPADRALVGQPC